MEKFTLNLARFLVERGHVVRGIAFEGDPLPGMEMRRLPRPRGMWRPMRDWLTGRHLAAAVARETDAEVIYGEQKMWGCDVLRPAGGVEDDYWRAHIRYRNPACRGLTALRHLSLKHALDIDAERRGMRDPRLRRVIVNSDMIRRQLLEKYPDLAGRVVVIHEGIERPAEGRVGARAELLSRWGLNPAAPTALFLGHDFRRKGLREAIQVIAEARRRRPECPWQLLVVGRDRPGPYRALARRLGLGSAVAFVGSVYPPDDCFGTAEVLLFPTWYDPFANVTLESLAFGVPVITTRQNGGSEAIEPGVNGWVVSEPEAIGEMADALALAGDPARRAGLREAARAAAGRLDLTGQLRAVESVLFAVAEERRAAGGRGDGRPG